MYSFAIDRGGTFCDVVCQCPDGRLRTLKLLSEDPSNYADAPTEGIRRLLEAETGAQLQRGRRVPTALIASIRMGTTVATNALLERRGAPTALVLTKGFGDLLHIGNQARPRIFDLRIQTLPPLYSAPAIECDERVVLAQTPAERLAAHAGCATVAGSTGEAFVVERAPDLAALRAELAAARARGATSCAVALMHSYAFSAHEAAVGALARELGFEHVSLSHEVMPSVKLVPRGHTACADAYLSPILRKYVANFARGFAGGLGVAGAAEEAQPSNAPAPPSAQSPALPTLLFMQSDGGLTDAANFSGHHAILSGPAGGCVGYARTTWDALGSSRPVCAFDMGGTSTDVSRFDGSFEHVFESTTAGVTINAPQLDINTVAAGGGSRLFFRAGLYVVGPESAGAHPGPLCYRKNGFLAVTDANVHLGRVVPGCFPKIFGPREDEPLDAAAATAAFEALAGEIAAFGAGRPSADEVAAGFIAVANEAMCRPIRALTQMKGHDLSAHVLACFGGAGPQHACAMAQSLGVRSVFISRFAGVLSAYGLMLADVVAEARAPCAERLACAPPGSEDPGECDSAVAASLAARLAALSAEAAGKLARQGARAADVTFSLFVHARYAGTDSGLMVQVAGEFAGVDAADVAARLLRTPRDFADAYRREFGFVLRGREVLAEDVRLRAVARSAAGGPAGQRGSPGHANPPPVAAPAPAFRHSVYFAGAGRVATPVFMLDSLAEGVRVEGPALILSDTTSIVVEPAFLATILRGGDILMDKVDAVAAPAVGSGAPAPAPAGDAAAEIACDPIRLSVFAHRFMGIAEQMGRTLQRTAVSVNMRERLDYSCALFGVDGGLVANAPHIPVHLGAMQDAVRFQLRHWGVGNLRDGDVLVSNHPQLAGGSHLPDITVITPVFHGSAIVFFVASRGHHADIGGAVPGSMPPLSKSLAEEGAAIVAHKLCSEGVFDEAGITAILKGAGSRNLPDCLSDLRAQVAANTRGIGLVRELIAETSGGLAVVHAYMRFIQKAAEDAVRDMLVSLSRAQGLPEVGVLAAEDHMDDGTAIALSITIDRARRSAVFDFSGTGPEVFGNTNAPRAVTYSAVIYCLRCLVGSDIPLNQGCLAPVEIIIPQGSILHPSPTAAVVGGNVLTSQRVVDVILRAFRACAASQGCMNNLTFGDSSFGFYETICGGAGAGPSWAGRSGVHTHMTNTRVTDPEIIERRYPVVLRQFGLRRGSGGGGRLRGGDGVVREVQFRRANLLVSILSERRATRPYGAAGGEDGARGRNLLLRAAENRGGSGADARAPLLSLGGKASLVVGAGDILRIETPGGGGWGRAGDGAEAVGVEGGSEQGFVPRASGSLNTKEELESDF